MVYFKIEFGVGHDKRAAGAQGGADKGGMEADGMTAALAEVERLKADRRFKTAANYLTALRSWCRFVGHEGWRFSCMTADEMGRYQRWLTQQGICLNTVSAYMRSLRALYNRVDGGRYACASGSPFDKVFTGRQRTRKRSVTADVVARLYRLQLPDGSALAMARDFFIFGFQAMGMPFVDMVYLRKSQVEGGIVRYARHKTGQPVVVSVTPAMADIMRRYDRPDSEYVFPVLTATDPAGLHRQYRHALRHYNHALHRLSATVGVPCHLSSYVVRHSWASIAYQHHIDIELIGKALGHTKASTTMVYIKSLFDKDLATANSALMQQLGLD